MYEMMAHHSKGNLQVIVAAPKQIKSNYRQPPPADTACPFQEEVKARPYTCAHCGKGAHHYVSWHKHGHIVAVTCGACQEPRKEAPASSNKTLTAVSAEKASDMQVCSASRLGKSWLRCVSNYKTLIGYLFERQPSLRPACKKWNAMDSSWEWEWQQSTLKQRKMQYWRLAARPHFMKC